ncbi:MAG: DNA repair protein RecO [Candidatus Levybacteria bacterium RBG_16_35_11]|nr:MAG: DNA repair protein RecO [Candidatus Levybacteria bacterium RBG_16_35_11]
MIRTYRTEGFVIKRRNFRELDRIITVFSKKNGKIQIKAPGVRKITSRRSGHIELLNYSTFTIYQGKSLPILTEVECMETYSFLKKDLNRISTLYYICELIEGLCPENQENIQVFHLLKDFLESLKKDKDWVSLLDNFEINLLTVLGYYRSDHEIAKINRPLLIERILERKLKTKQIKLC